MPRRSRTESIYVKFESDPHINTPGFKLAFNVSEEGIGNDTNFLNESYYQLRCFSLWWSTW